METLRLPATMMSLERFRLFVLERLHLLEPTAEMVFKVELVLEEVLTNVIRNAYPETPGEMEVSVALEPRHKLSVRVRDWGVPFNPLERPDPNLSEEVSERQVGGLGIHFIRHLVAELAYQWREGANTLAFSFMLQGE